MLNSTQTTVDGTTNIYLTRGTTDNWHDLLINALDTILVYDSQLEEETDTKLSGIQVYQEEEEQ